MNNLEIKRELGHTLQNHGLRIRAIADMFCNPEEYEDPTAPKMLQEDLNKTLNNFSKDLEQLIEIVTKEV